MSRHRNLVIVWVVVVVGAVVDATNVTAAPNRSPQESAIVACHKTILDAGRTLTSDVEGHLGRCVTRGIDCLTAAGDPSACCARVAERCDDDRNRILEAEHEFENLVARRSCTRVPFADLLAPDGLGYAGVAERCACLTPPVAVDSLATFATCLRRLVEEDVAQRIALVDAPRTREALACLGVDAEFPATLLDRPSICETCGGATPTASATAAVTPAATGTTVTTPLATATAAPTVAASATGSPTPAATPSETPAPTVEVPTSSPTGAAPTATIAPTLGATGTPIPGPTLTPLLLPSATSTPTPTSTPLVATATRTATPTVTASVTALPTPPPSVCGNGIVEGDEECDGDAIDDSGCTEDVCTCDDFCDDPGGTLGCNPNCTVDFSRCTAGGCEF